jgi:hypothetical protein
VALKGRGRIVPAAVADVVVDHPIGREEFVARVGQPADHDNGSSDRPGEPRQTARKADEEFRVLDPARAFREGMVSRHVFRPGRNMGPDEPLPVGRFLIDTYDPIAGVLEKRDDFTPAGRIVPKLRLQGALHGDADIGLFERPRVVFDRDPWPLLGWVDAENIACSAMQ